jgi:NADPH:quinone reductase-like Zn-dependent oxidoreductase
MMNAAYIEELTGADGIRYGRMPVPRPGAREVLVRVAAVTANHVDTFVRSGRFATDLHFPQILSRDLVGTVVDVGTEVAQAQVSQAQATHAQAAEAGGFAAGDMVWSHSLGYDGRQGAAAEFALVEADRLYHLPAGVDPLQAVAVLHPGATAFLALQQHARLQSGECVYVGGGAGQVGSALIVQAARAGARVVASARSEDASYCRELGAEAVLDYRSPTLATELAEAAAGRAAAGSGRTGVDVYVETSGKHDFAQAIGSLAKGGRIILLAGVEAESPLPVGKLYTRDGSLLGFVISNAGVAELARSAACVNELLAGGLLRPRKIEVMPLAQLALAHRLLESGQVRGTRLVLVPDGG